MQKRLELCWKHFKRDWQLWAIIIIPVIYFAVFNYAPMYGIQIAFRDYRPRAGITGSEWVGLKWFVKFLTNPKFGLIFKNTVVLSLYSMIASFPLPIVFALMLNAMESKRYKSVAQTVTYLPHFISMVVMVSILQMIFSPVSGIYGNMYRLFGGEGYPADFRGLVTSFRHMYVWSGVWQELGWNTIIYTSALSAVSQEHHEAAMIDGASRLKRIRHIDLPAIMPTVCTLLILRFGSIIGVGFEKAYMLQSPLNQEVSEVISTYVFKYGMDSFRSFSYGTAVSLFNTAINMTLMFIVNKISKKISEDEISLF
jgi:putative aldouronate transport system permease protein